MTGPSVFISHSIRDPGDAPVREATEDDAAFAARQAAWARTRALAVLREMLVEKLEAADFEPWLDERRLEPPASWRDGLHIALARAKGAVILLDERAVQESDWVLKETTILTWLRAVGVPVVIVPVLVGVSAKSLASRGFGPTQVREIQALRVDPGTLESTDSVIAACLDNDELQPIDAAAEAIVAVVARGFELNREAAPLTDIDRWVADFVANFGDAQNEHMRLMLRALGLSEAGALPSADALLTALRRTQFATQIDAELELRRCVARELLLTDLRHAVEAFRTLKNVPVRWGLIERLLEPLSVSADAAQPVLAAARRRPGERVVIVNTTRPSTARWLVSRALFAADTNELTACQEDPADPEVVVSWYREQLREFADPDDPEHIAALAISTDLSSPPQGLLISAAYFAYVDLAGGLTDPASYLEALLADDALRHLTFVVAAGADYEQLAARFGCDAVLLPEGTETAAHLTMAPIRRIRKDLQQQTKAS